MANIDPVCGMTVAPDGPHRMQYGGTTYLFCSAGCRARFKDQPEQFLAAPDGGQEHHDRHGHGDHGGGQDHHCDHDQDRHHHRHEHAQRGAAVPSGASGASAAPGADPVRYRCPMCPEVDEPRPGACPSCGMALEPHTLSAAPEDDGELRTMTRRLVVSALLTAPLIALPFTALAALPAFGWLQLAIASPVVLWGAAPFFQRAWTSVVNRSAQHVHPGRPRYRGRLPVQRGRHHCAHRVPHRGYRGRRRRGPVLLRERRRHHHAGAARPGA